MKRITAHFPASGVTIFGEFEFEPGQGPIQWMGTEEAIRGFLARQWDGNRERRARFDAGRFARWAHGMAEHLGEPVRIEQEGDLVFYPE